MADMKIKLPGLDLDNPVIAASGCFGFGYEFNEYYDINILGTFSTKGTTLEERFGNPTPRVAEGGASGMINAIGLQNPGAQNVVDVEFKELKKTYKKKVLANVSGSQLEDYVETIKIISADEIVGAIELNISCPNVKEGGMAFGTCPDTAFELTKACVAVSKKPVYVKLSPNVTDIVSIAKAVEKAGAHGISMINTLVGMRLNLRTAKPIIANKMGGFSGPAIFPVALRMVYQVAQSVNIPVIGIGGVSCAYDIIEMMYAGASAVQVGAQNLVNPMICKEIIDELPKIMKELGIEKLSDIVGKSHGQ